MNVFRTLTSSQDSSQRQSYLSLMMLAPQRVADFRGNQGWVGAIIVDSSSFTTLLQGDGGINSLYYSIA